MRLLRSLGRTFAPALAMTVALSACTEDEALVAPALTDVSTDSKAADIGLGDAQAGTDVQTPGPDADDASQPDADDSAQPDGAQPDAEDVGTDDASPDAATDDAAQPDADDVGTDDVSQPDAGTDDVAQPDAGTDDVGAPDADVAGTDDVGSPDADVTGTDDVAAPDADMGGTDDAAGTDDVGAPDADAGQPDAGPVCKTDADCPAPANPCEVAKCKDQVQCVVEPKADGATCDDGNKCTDADACKTGQCVGTAKACDDANACTDDACDTTTGTCASIPNSAPCDDGNACTGGDVCKTGACQGDPAAVVCDDKNACTDDACDPKTGCSATNNTKACGDDKCLTGQQCKDGTCQGGTKTDCDDGNACTVDGCDAKTGLCTFTAAATGAACDDGNACTEGDGCGGGKCKGASAKVCDDGNPCTTDACDPKSGCTVTNNSATCDDGSACTTSDVCKDGKCGGTAKKCDDGNPCTDDACDAKTGCTVANNAAPCSLGTACETGQCKAGKCESVGKTSCDDLNPCTTDTCDAGKGCLHAPVADKTVCKAGDKCENASLCMAGKCEAGVKVSCDDSNLCTTDACDPTSGCNWSPNTLPCDDANACTTGEVCGVVAGKGPSCVPGKPIDPKTCDDGNACTTDGCDTKTGCTHVNTTAPCDDGNVCTTGEVCAAGKCQGGKLAGCDDGNACTVDNCDAKTGNCSWTAFTGTCDDKNPCTSNDVCQAAKCVGTLKACDDKNPCTSDFCDTTSGNCAAKPVDGGTCDDGDLCTAGDVCGGGKCAGKAAACDDGNVCTNDACDKATGKCAYTPNTAPCGGADLCTTGGTCSLGKCTPGTTPKCDDKNPCTVDKCDAATGNCSVTNVADGTACDDGIACSAASACTAGKCQPKAPCTMLDDAFPCNTASSWKMEKPANKQVLWNIDMTPVIPDTQEHQCSLNFNDGTDHCDSVGGGWCQLPTGKATSPTLDFTTAVGLTPVITFDVYYDVDIQPQQSAGWDQPKVTLRDAGTGAELGVWLLPVNSNTVKKWHSGYQIAMSQAAGKKVTIDFSLNLPFQQNYDPNNTGAGVFVDNFKAQAVLAPENCTDGIDNNGDGKIDCADAACTGNTACIETACGDAVDNDKDGATDCADSDCKTALLCGKPIAEDSFDFCDGGKWDYASNNSTAVWAVDATPAAVVPLTGKCSLNYNDGTDYGVTQNNNPISVAGAASWKGSIDASAYKELAVSFQAYLDTEGTGGNGATYDILWLQVSTSDFAGCCAANQTCSYNSNNCNTDTTKSYPVSKAVLKKWFVVNQTLHSVFAGKKFKLRFKFDTVDSQFNQNFAGPFVDDFKVFGK